MYDLQIKDITFKNILTQVNFDWSQGEKLTLWERMVLNEENVLNEAKMFLAPSEMNPTSINKC